MQALDALDASAALRALRALVHANWGIRALHLQPLPSGHTNKSYLVEVDRGSARKDLAPLVLRVSWPGKAAHQVLREQTLLAALGARVSLPPVPRPWPTLDGRSYAQAGESWVHLFDCIPGRAGFPRHAVQLAEMRDIAAAAMRTLARLHAAMGDIPTGPAPLGDAKVHAVTWLAQRHARVLARPTPVLPEGLAGQYAGVMARAGAYLAKAALRIPGPTGWLHGDYHAGNLLFSEADRTRVSVTGILDFDDAGIGSPWLEAAFALFALTRDATVEHAFAYDAGIWEQGLQAYARQRRTRSDRSDIGIVIGIDIDIDIDIGAEAEAEADPATMAEADAMANYLRMNRAPFMALFCIDQVLIHLEAAQRGLWQPGPGIGFLGCWHQLSRDVSPSNDAPPSSILTASTVAGRASP